MRYYLKFIVYCILWFNVQFIFYVILDALQKSVASQIPTTPVFVILAILSSIAFVWLDGNGPIPFKHMYWQFVYLQKLVSEYKDEHKKYISLEVASDSTPQTQDLIEALLQRVQRSRNFKGLLLGISGAGKTFSSQVFTYRLARRYLWRLWPRPVIPILLHNFKSDNWDVIITNVINSLFQKVPSQGRSELITVLMEFLRKGKLLLVIDGLDRQSPESYSNFITLRNKVSNETGYLLTCRPGFLPIDKIHHSFQFQIMPLSDESVFQFVLNKVDNSTNRANVILSYLDDGNWLDPSGLGRIPFWLNEATKGGHFQSNRARLLRNRIETELQSLPTHPPVQLRWNPVEFPEYLVGGLAYLAYEIRVYVEDNLIMFPAISLPEARRVIREYIESIRIQGANIDSNPDNYLGTAAFIGLLSSSTTEYMLHSGLDYATISADQIFVEFAHDEWLDYFTGIELSKRWNEFTIQNRINVLTNVSWWDAIVYMICISPSRMISEFEEVQDTDTMVAPGIIPGLQIVSKVISREVEANPVQLPVDESFDRLMHAIHDCGLSLEYINILELLRRWVPHEFDEIFLSLLNEDSGLHQERRRVLVEWLVSNNILARTITLLKILQLKQEYLSARVVYALLSSLNQLKINIQEITILSNLLLDPEMFQSVFPLSLAILFRNPNFIEEVIHLSQESPTSQLMKILLEKDAYPPVFFATLNHVLQKESRNLAHNWGNTVSIVDDTEAEPVCQSIISDLALSSFLCILGQDDLRVSNLLLQCLCEIDNPTSVLSAINNRSEGLSDRIRVLLRNQLRIVRGLSPREKLPRVEKKKVADYATVLAEVIYIEQEVRCVRDEVLKLKTGDFRRRLALGEELDEILPEVYAVVKEVARRVLGLQLNDIQIIGGMVLHEGKIVEVAGGEGKTLMAALPLYLNALKSKGVHLVTVNDYLARRDARWMGPIFEFLGLSVGVLQQAARTEGGRKAYIYNPRKVSSDELTHHLQLVDRREAYAADVTYGTNNEFGFDYLRDNMARSLEARSQRGHHYAILDEVDNILIDEARTPLIISGPAQDDPELYIQMATVVKQMNAEDYEVNERDRSISLTELGEDHVEKILGRSLRDPDRPEDITPEQARFLGYLQQALRAEHLFRRNKEYVVQGGRVIIVDSFTGRLMPGRRWSDGLHQAVEAKEGVRVRQENVTYATITLQNYFRKYTKLSGMTGTALTEAEEFNEIYKVDVLPLPMNLEFRVAQQESDLVEVEYRENGNQFSYYAAKDDLDERPIFWRRKDYPDIVYRTEEAKLRAVTMEILRRCVLGQPLLVGTTSVELSEVLSKRLRSDSLQRVATILILRDLYMEVNDVPAEGMRIDELESLNKSLDEIKSSDLRPFARELDLHLNPTRPENLERLARILDLDSKHHERIAELLQSGINHNVLNAKKHTEESQIIEGAGAKGAVTIATNMAGRGVDIVLGGSLSNDVAQRVTRVARDTYERADRLDEREEMAQLLRSGSGVGYGKASQIQRLERWRREFADLDRSEMGIYEADVETFDQFIKDREHVLQAGGLHVLGCVRHEARRIDNQLRGRAARQGDPGSSQFFLSLEDDLMRLFGGSQVSNLMQRLNIDDAMPIAHNIVNRVIEQSQGRVEGANFDVRKHLLEYDDVLNQQREVFYSQRDRVFTKGDLSEDINEMLRFEVERHVEASFEDDEGAWKLLAWLEEIQPSLNVDTDGAYPSYMLRVLSNELGLNADTESLFQALIGVAQQALNAQHDHIRYAIEQQMDRTLERLDDQVEQRVEMAEMAIEGAMLEAEESGMDVDPNILLQSVEKVTGVRINIDSESLNQIRENPYAFRKSVPHLIEGGLGVRVWSGLVQSAERRVGEPLNMDQQLTTPIDWSEAGEQLLNAVDRIGTNKTERLLADIERDLRIALERVKTIDEALILRLLVRMSYGKQAYFDKKTHQRKSAVVARLTYPFSAARYLDGWDSDDLIDDIMTHLEGARQTLARSLGQSELTRLAHTKFTEFEDATRENLQREIDPIIYEKVISDQSIASLDESAQVEIAAVFGSRLLAESHRTLILSVGDRLWIDYLTQMEALRTSIGLEAYAQRDPLVQYKSRAFDMFGNLLATMRSGVVSRMFRVRTTAQASQPAPGRQPSASRAKKKRRRRRR